MDAQKTALIIGATGGIGGETARTLKRRGWRVVALHRSPEEAGRMAPEFEWVQGDAMNAAAVIRAAVGASIIFHGANPPGYHNWKELAPAMLESAIAAARASGARILFPGNVYNFGPDAGTRVNEDARQAPVTRKGAIRVAMERRLEQAAADGVRSLIVRAGDFFGPRATGSWLAQGMVQIGRPVRFVLNPGRRGVGHAWAYIPDLAETFARLAEIEAELPDFERFHFGGHWVDDNRDLAEAIAWAAGRPKAPVLPFPWPMLGVLSPVVEMAREMAEMRYLWRTPLRLSNAKLVSRLGAEPHTPLAVALRRTLEGLGCIDPHHSLEALRRSAAS